MSHFHCTLCGRALGVGDTIYRPGVTKQNGQQHQLCDACAPLIAPHCIYCCRERSPTLEEQVILAAYHEVIHKLR